jgi:hypothetical protein
MAVKSAHEDGMTTKATMGPGRSYPFFKAGVLIGAPAGFLSGMADANTFTRDLVTLIIWSLVGAVLIGAIGALAGWLVDLARDRRPRI